MQESISCTALLGQKDVYKRQVFANVSADKTVTIKSENISVKEALNMVKKQTGINIMYEDATLNNVPLKLTLNKEPLEQALSVICSQAGMRYELVENNYVLILPIDRNAKRRTITGVIKDDTGDVYKRQE